MKDDYNYEGKKRSKRLIGYGEGVWRWTVVLDMEVYTKRVLFLGFFLGLEDGIHERRL